jgi:membrane protease YdiL (CAAX protease family)
VIFGLAHSYQGVKGVLGTALGGFVLGLLFLLSESLIPSIVLHVLLDLQVAYILRPVQTPLLNR